MKRNGQSPKALSTIILSKLNGKIKYKTFVPYYAAKSALKYKILFCKTVLNHKRQAVTL